MKDCITMLEKAIEDKSKELDQRESIVAEREAKVDHVLNEQEKMKKFIKLQVGSVIYHTTADTLLKVKDSFFHGLLNPNFQKYDNDQPIFIDRNGKVFEYILEYLTYGELLSPIEDIGLLKKLAKDAEYYLLIDLEKEVLGLIKNYGTLNKTQSVAITFPWCRLRNANLSGSGYYWSWNATDSIDQQFYRLSTSSYQNDTITILQPGLYHIIIRTCCSTSANYYMALYLSGSDVARCYSSSSAHYYNSFHINEIRKLSKDNYLQVYQTYSSSPLNGDPYNVFEVIRLGD